MTLLDIVIVILAVAGAYVGWRKALTGQLGALAGMLAGIILCRWFGAELTAAFTSPDDTPNTVLLHTVLAYVVLGVGGYVGVRILAGMIGKVARTLHINGLNRAAGALFGAFEWILGLSILLNLWVAVFPDTKLRSSDNRLADAVMDLGPRVLGSETARQILDLKDLERPDFLNGEKADSTDVVNMRADDNV